VPKWKDVCLACSDAKRQHVDLVKDRRLFNQQITKLQDECEKMMVDKFGRVVNLEELETMSVNQQLDDVKDRLTVAEEDRAADLQAWTVRHSHSRSTVLCYYHSE